MGSEMCIRDSGDTPTDVHDSIELLIKLILHSEVNVVARTRFG